MDELSFYTSEVIEETYRKAEAFYGRRFTRPSFDFRKKGACGATADPNTNTLSFNRVLFEQNFEDYIKNTIPHECAHLICDEMHGVIMRGKVYDHHGPKWQSVMRVLGLEPLRCHSYDTSAVKRKRKTLERLHKYSCPCHKAFMLTDIKHNRIQRGRRYRCRACKGIITHVFTRGVEIPVR